MGSDEWGQMNNRKRSHAPVLLLPQLRHRVRQLLRPRALLLLKGARKCRPRGALNLRAQLGCRLGEAADKPLPKNGLVAAENVRVLRGEEQARRARQVEKGSETAQRTAHVAH